MCVYPDILLSIHAKYARRANTYRAQNTRAAHKSVYEKPPVRVFCG